MNSYFSKGLLILIFKMIFKYFSNFSGVIFKYTEKCLIFSKIIDLIEFLNDISNLTRF